MRAWLLLASFPVGASMFLGACSGDDEAATGPHPSSSSGTGGAGGSGPMHPPKVIYIDVDDHGLKALWESKSPTLQKMAKEGSLAYSRVDIPTHSNQSNITLVTGAWPEATNVPHNSWLDRANGFKQPFSVSQLSVGDYIYFDLNPLGKRVDSIYGAAHDQGGKSTFVGLLPPFEHGADEVHFTTYQSKLFGFQLDEKLIDMLLSTLHYPTDYVAQIHLDGPPQSGETLNRFTLRDAGEAFKASVMKDGAPPDVMFVWDFIALDGNPTDTDGASGPAVKKVVEDIDAGVASLMAAVASTGWDDAVSYVLTLDHGKTDAHNQVCFEKQLGDVVMQQGIVHGMITPADVVTLNEDGDVLIYAKLDGAGTPAGAQRQSEIAHGLLELIQTGSILGVDTARTLSWDGYLETRRFHDVRSQGPNNPDIIAFPADDWTLNDVAGNATPGPINRPNPYGRHGGFSTDELYVPAIFYGPAFKKGVLLPLPIDHADIAPTVLAAIGKTPPKTAQGGVVAGVLASDESGVETTALPADPSTSRDVVLANGGYDPMQPPKLKAGPASGAVIIDVSGLYEDHFPTGASVAALVKAGTRFVSMHTRFRDWPVTEYQMLTGSYPVRANWVPFAEDDPAQTTPPGLGLLMMPPAASFIADKPGYDAWHTGKEQFAEETMFDAAKKKGFATAVLGESDFHLQHVDTTNIDVLPMKGQDVGAYFKNNSKALVLYSVDGGADPEKAADDAVKAIDDALAAATLTDTVVVCLTSRGGATIDAMKPDAYGPGSARHVPLVLRGPNVRSGAVVGGAATPSDIAPTLLFALGFNPSLPDLAWGTIVNGGMSSGKVIPVPANDLSGRILVQAFDMK